METFLKSLILDRWYKMLIALGFIGVMYSLSFSVKVLNNEVIFFGSLSLFFAGVALMAMQAPFAEPMENSYFLKQSTRTKFNLAGAILFAAAFVFAGFAVASL